MKKYGIYFLIFVLLFTVNPIPPVSVSAEESEDEELEEEEVVLLSEQVEGEIALFESVEDIEENQEAEKVSDDTPAILLHINSTEEVEEIEYVFIRYEKENENHDEEQHIVEGYVESDMVIPLESVDEFKEKRLKEQEEQDETDDSDDESEEVESDDNVTSENEEDDSETNDEESNEKESESEEASEEDYNEELNDKVDKSNEKSENNSRESLNVSSFSASTELLSQGQSSLEVKTLKNNLNKLGFKVTMNYPERFGPSTKKVVKEFQKYYSIKATGQADEFTLNKIDELLSSLLFEGDSSPEVKTLKNNLNKLGFKVTMNYPERFGPSTTKAVKEFQKFYNLKVTGVVELITKQKIDKELDNHSILDEGQSSPKIRHLKEDLNELGFTVTMNYPNRFGPSTKKAVKEFQKYYSINATGQADEITLNKIDEILSTSLLEGQSSTKIKQLKENLNQLGFKVTMNYPERYGPGTTKAVEALQQYYRLKITGVAEEKTLEKIKKELSNTLQQGQRNEEVKKLKEDLNKLGFKVTMNYPNKYGPGTKKAVENFQRHYNLSVSGIANKKTISKMEEVFLTSLSKGQSSSKIKKLKNDLNTLGFKVTMNYPNKYGAKTKSAVEKFQKSNKLPISGIADEVTMEKIKSLVKNKSNVKIFIDPGHGGKDPGASASNVLEKNLTLDIAKRIQKHLRKYDGVTIKMSRTKDETLSLSQRSKMANDWNADFYFSVHINSGGGHGLESFIYNNAPTKDEIKKQKIIHDNLINNVDDRDRGKKQANFHVLRETNMTSLLTEYLFVDTASDRIKLVSEQYREKLAKFTAEGIVKAYNLKK